jgi:predicted  nucleic acid-binding Zn-ribbon protein
MEIIQSEKYDANNKIIDQEAEILSLNVREEKAMTIVQEIQEKLRNAIDDKRELEIEFVALKKNFLNVSAELDKERQKNENLGLELINTVNENKSLQNELSGAYKNSTNKTEEGARLHGRVESLTSQWEETKEALIMAKAEIERLKNELMKQDIVDQARDLDRQGKQLQYEKNFIDLASKNNNELGRLNEGAEKDLLRVKEERLVFESQRLELIAQNKKLQRKMHEFEERFKELSEEHGDLKSKKTQFEVQ